MKALGDSYENFAAAWLHRQGLSIIRRNYRCKAGEIDLVARHRGQLVFIEVRARSNPRYASAAASVGRAKQRKLIRAARFFLQRHPAEANSPCRFDVIAIDPRQFPAESAVRWIRSAFTS